jgi:hypothetical protein
MMLYTVGVFPSFSQEGPLFFTIMLDNSVDFLFFIIFHGRV